MPTDDSRERRELRGIAAGAIRFDEFGRIIVDPKVQADAGGYDLPQEYDVNLM